MMSVRFENGHTIQYNSAYFVRWGNPAGTPPMNCLYDKDPKAGGSLIAAIPLTAIVEWVFPCRIYNSLDRTDIESLEREVRSLKRRLREAKKGKNARP